MTRALRVTGMTISLEEQIHEVLGTPTLSLSEYLGLNRVF